VVGPDGGVAIGIVGGFGGLVPGIQYDLHVEEDDEVGVGNPSISRDYKPPSTGNKDKCPCHTSARATQLANDLRKMNLEDIRDQTDKYKELKEARDLEDVLYG